MFRTISMPQSVEPYYQRSIYPASSNMPITAALNGAIPCYCGAIPMLLQVETSTATSASAQFSVMLQITQGHLCNTVNQCENNETKRQTSQTLQTNFQGGIYQKQNRVTPRCILVLGQVELSALHSSLCSMDALRSCLLYTSPSPRDS